MIRFLFVFFHYFSAQIIRTQLSKPGDLQLFLKAFVIVSSPFLISFASLVIKSKTLDALNQRITLFTLSFCSVSPASIMLFSPYAVNPFVHMTRTTHTRTKYYFIFDLMRFENVFCFQTANSKKRKQ